MRKAIFSLTILFLAQLSFLYGASKNLDFVLVDKSQYITTQPKQISILKKNGDYTLSSLFRDSSEIEWAKRFDIAELGGVDDRHITRKVLKESGIFGIKHRIGYDWMPATYYYTSDKNRKFVDWLYENRKFVTLNPDGGAFHCKKNGYDWCQDYYYNYGNRELFNKRVENLITDMKKRGFNGLFFDWASGGFILSEEYKSVREYFKKMNPKKNYFKLVSSFYKALKDRGVFVVTNQAFRKEKYLLKNVTYDMTESYITTTSKKNIRLQIKGKGWVEHIKVTNYYPIYKNSNSLKDSLHFIDLLTSYKKKYKKDGFKNFIYLNYIAPEYERIYDSAQIYRLKKPKNAIYFGYAMAKLTDNIVYAEISDNKKMERDDIYFYDLGKPLGESYEKIDAINAYVRFYTNGFVLASGANSSDLYLRLSSKYIPKERHIYDAYNNTWLKSNGHKVVVKLSFKKETFSQKILPTGRVYLYNQD